VDVFVYTVFFSAKCFLELENSWKSKCYSQRFFGFWECDPNNMLELLKVRRRPVERFIVAGVDR
jgi:hypothetical protein